MHELKDYSPEDFAKIKLTDLQSIQANLEKGIELRKVAEKVEWSNQLKELIKKSGFSLEELAGDTKLSSKDKTVKESKPPKYRNPDNHEETWSGMGAKKKWLVAMLENGRTLDEFLIQ
ncbi:MAG: H-NS histone family protein [Comamonadaceae bacterium]|nr:MAG: H-NS histone family protein [Comamonadaceae bacterium]